jgi:hypothetical protein
VLEFGGDAGRVVEEVVDYAVLELPEDGQKGEALVMF